MFMTCFGEVDLRITNGVGGGLNSMSAFYLLRFASLGWLRLCVFTCTDDYANSLSNG